MVIRRIYEYVVMNNEYINPPEAPEEVSSEIEYLKDVIWKIMMGGKNHV